MAAQRPLLYNLINMQDAPNDTAALRCALRDDRKTLENNFLQSDIFDKNLAYHSPVTLPSEQKITVSGKLYLLKKDRIDIYQIR